MVSGDVTDQTEPLDQFVKDVPELRQTEECLATNLLSMRLFVPQVGGQNTGHVSLMFEYDDFAPQGATEDAELAAEPGFLAVAGGDDIFEETGQRLYDEVPY